MSFDIEYWLKTPKEEKVKGRKRKKLKLRLEAEAEAIDKAEDEAQWTIYSGLNSVRILSCYQF